MIRFDPEGLAAYGWAPGLYIGHKCACGSEFGEADKRSWRCKPCAIKAKDAARVAWPAGCHDTASCERHRVCVYAHCRHTGKALGQEIDDALVLGAIPLGALPGPTDANPLLWAGRPIDEMSREDAIRALKTAIQQWVDANQRTTETHDFYREMIRRRFERPLPQDNTRA